MSGSSYDANYQSGLSYLKLHLKEQALDCFNRAYSQLAQSDKSEKNKIYFSLLSNLVQFALRDNNLEKAKTLVDEGLHVKNNHADLLYLNCLLFLDDQRYDEMLGEIIHFLMALSARDAEDYGYLYTHPAALDEMYDNLLPIAYQRASEGEAIRGVVEGLCKKTQDKGLKKALEVMQLIDLGKEVRAL